MSVILTGTLHVSMYEAASQKAYSLKQERASGKSMHQLEHEVTPPHGSAAQKL